MKRDQDQEGIQERRWGAPDGPRQRKENYDGSDPLEYPGHEAVAQFLAFPESQREFKSVIALGKHFQVTTMTIYRWKRDPDVLLRAKWLSMPNKTVGKLLVRREYEHMVEKQVERAKNGDVQAMKFCEALTWSEDDQDGCISIDELAPKDDLYQVASPGAPIVEQCQAEADVATKKSDALAEPTNTPE